MASLTLKNLPEDLFRALRKAAETDRRSLTKEIIHLLETALERRPERSNAGADDVDAQVAAWRKLAGKWVPDVDLANEPEQIVEQGLADCIAFCRPLIAEPGLVARWKSGDRSVARCLSCNQCFDPASRGEGIRCVLDRS